MNNECLALNINQKTEELKNLYDTEKAITNENNILNDDIKLISSHIRKNSFTIENIRTKINDILEYLRRHDVHEPLALAEKHV